MRGNGKNLLSKLLNNVMMESRNFIRNNPRYLGRELLISINQHTLSRLRLFDCTRIDGNGDECVNNLKIKVDNSIEDFEYELSLLVSKSNLREEIKNGTKK